MPPIQIRILAGSSSGRMESLDHASFSFGRHAENGLTVDAEFVSRRHGELSYDEGQWRLTNLSTNGCEVAGKRVGRKGSALRDRDVVSIGGAPVFEVRLVAGDTPPPVEAAPVAESSVDADDRESEAGGDAKPKGKRSLYMMLGIYLAVMLGGILALYAFLGPGASTNARALPRALTAEEIRSVIVAPLAAVQSNEREAAAQLDIARTYAQSHSSRADALYQMHRAYRMYLAYANKRFFDSGEDQLQFRDAEQRLIQQTQDRYNRGRTLLLSGNFRDAQESFRDLTLFYNDPQSRIYASATEHRKYAAERLKSRSFR